MEAFKVGDTVRIKGPTSPIYVGRTGKVVKVGTDRIDLPNGKVHFVDEPDFIYVDFGFESGKVPAYSRSKLEVVEAR